MTTFYNEIDRGAAEWLRQLISAEQITEGRVDERSIADLQPADLAGVRRVHLFAGIGGWDLALRLAGWPDDWPVWTGSCPCQPFSAAGKRKGAADERHLWPEMFRLIKSVRPPCVFGEQVAGAINPGWLDGIFADLETAGYTCGAVVLGAHSAGAPHIRQRIYWVAYASGTRLPQRIGDRRIQREAMGTQPREAAVSGSDACNAWSGYRLIHFRDGKTRRIESSTEPLVDGLPGRVGLLRGYGNAIVPQVAAVFIKAFMMEMEDVA